MCRSQGEVPAGQPVQKEKSTETGLSCHHTQGWACLSGCLFHAQVFQLLAQNRVLLSSRLLVGRHRRSRRQQAAMATFLLLPCMEFKVWEEAASSTKVQPCPSALPIGKVRESRPVPVLLPVSGRNGPQKSLPPPKNRSDMSAGSCLPVQPLPALAEVWGEECLVCWHACLFPQCQVCPFLLFSPFPVLPPTT